MSSLSIVLRVLVTVIAAATTAFAQQRVAYHTTLVGKLDPAPNQGGRYSALWGYVAPDGREYALLGGYRGTHIIDVTSTPPRQVAFIEGSESGWREMKTYGTHAYVVSEGGSGLQVIDLSGLPGRAVLVRQDQSVFTTAHTISQEGRYIYVHGSNVSAGFNGGTIVFDVGADPVRPTMLGAWTERYVHDAVIYNDTMYAAAINDGRLDIVYLGADRRQPRLVTDVVYPGAGTHNADLTADHRYIMTTDEIGNTGKTLKVWDRSDIESIRLVADFTAVPDEIIHNVQTKGDRAVVSWYTAGTRIIDISNPADPVEVAYYDTYPGAAHSYAGNWGTYPWLPSGRIISSDMQTGLYVFTYDGSSRGEVSGVVSDARTGAPIAGAVVSVPELGRTVVTDLQGRYRFAAADGDTLGYRVVVRDYHEAAGRFALVGGGTRHDIALEPIIYAPLTITARDAVTGELLPSVSYHALTPTGGATGEAAFRPSPVTLLVPQGETATVLIGAWGYLPELVDAAPGSVTVSMRRGYLDDAELDLGWSFVAPGDNATAGRWARAVPRITLAPDNSAVQPGADRTPNGTVAFLTGPTTVGTAPGTSDVDSGRTSLTSPPMDLTRYADPELAFQLWYTRDQYPFPDAVNDTLHVLISDDDGATWTVARRVFGTGHDWQAFRIPVRDVLMPTARMRVRFVAADEDLQSWVEALVDDFSVVERGAASVGASGAVVAVRVAPNPARDRVTLAAHVRAGTVRVSLHDALGREVRSVATTPAVLRNGLEIDLRSLPAGVYTWRIVADVVVAEGRVVRVEG